MGGSSVSGRNAAPLYEISLWNSEECPHDELIQMLGSCIELFDAYKANYEKTKNRLKNDKSQAISLITVNDGDMESSLLFIEKHMNHCFQN